MVSQRLLVQNKAKMSQVTRITRLPPTWQTGRRLSQSRRPTADATPTPEERTGSEPPLLNQVLEQAQDAGIVVEDYLEGEARRLWVHITEAPDSRSRKLVRQLMALGFEFWPGKGYWR